MTIDRWTGGAFAAWLVLRGLAMRRRRKTLAERLADLPRNAPTARPIVIHWNAHQIPYVEAEDEPDLAVGLGIVHAHLRLGQMEIMRRLARGRVSEMIGPLGIEIDRTLRLMDFARAVPQIVAGLDPGARAWTEGFVRGVNHVLSHAELPEEMRLLGIGREPWTLADLFANARLAAADVSWIVSGRLLRARASMPRAEWRALWPRLLAGGMPNPEAAPAGLLARVGSNAAAVAGSRSAGGGAMLAADPHLSVALPNIWLAAGMCCPTLNAVGLMPTGFPVIAIGRNRHIAWGGTNLHAAASDLFDVSALPLTERAETIRVRGFGTRRLALRESPLGPVVSDGRLFRAEAPVALRWIGHAASDELGAMLGVMRADGAAAFTHALQGFAVPGQNMVYATTGGDVGHVLAVAVPSRDGAPADLVLPPSAAAAWDHLARTGDFPVIAPLQGVVATANDEAPPGRVPAGFFYSPQDRVRRLRALLGGAAMLDLAAMARTQTDVQGRLDTLRALLARAPDHPARDRLQAWDGCYDIASEGALLFEAVMADLSKKLPDPSRLDSLSAIWMGRALIAGEILALDDAALQPLLRGAFDVAVRELGRHGRWGNAHRMRLRHYLGAVPVLGRRYAFGDYPSPGGNDTLDKTGHGPMRGRHAVTYGASARFLADMADPDANRVVMLGGQDGWLGSDTFLDQVPLWRAGQYIDLPLRPATARLWPHRSELARA